MTVSLEILVSVLRVNLVSKLDVTIFMTPQIFICEYRLLSLSARIHNLSMS